MRALKKIKDFILDTLFPINCINCGKENTWLCGDCLSRLPAKLEQFCPICEKNITPDGRVCFFCRKKSDLSGILVASSYKNKTVSSAVHYYKYRFVESLKAPLGEILARAYLNSRLSVPDLIFPVPLHKRRLRWRGFNQAESLANHISRNLTPGFDIPVINNLLIRKRFTHPQMKIKNYFRRKNNIQNAFALNKKFSIPKNQAAAFFSDSCKRQPPKNLLKDKTVLLVDDIATTGATLFECAKVLKQNEAKEIFAIVIARQEFKNKLTQQADVK